MEREEFAQLSETRAILETAALRLAVERNHPALVKQWKRLVGAMATAMRDGQRKRYSDCDGAFHTVMIDLAANPFLAAAGQSFSAKMAAVRNRQGSEPEHMAKSYQEHAELLDLVTRNEVDAAVDLLQRHIRDKGESFWATPNPSRKSRWQRISELSE
jgi:DNA-binding GntR family transcriptional regulator